MTSTHKDREEVYAILRWDGFHGRDAEPEVLVTVKEIVRGRDVAEAEVERLKALKESKDVLYWCQPTRLFAESESAGPGAA